jgi:porin
MKGLRAARFCASVTLGVIARAAEAGTEAPERLWVGRDSWRGEAERKGVYVNANYTGEVLFNRGGGFEDGETYQGLGELGLEFDLGALAGWAGSKLVFHALRIHGDDPSAELVGDYNYVSNISGENTTRLFHAWYGWTGERLSVRAGLLAVDDDFSLSTSSALFVSSSFGALPCVLANTSAPVWPLSAPGVFMRYDASEQVFIQAAAYDGDAGNYLTDPHGTKPRLRSSEGVMTMLETGRNLTHGGRATVLKAGVWHHSGDFRDFRSGEVKHGNQGFYVVADHELTREGAVGSRWSVFARAGRVVRDERNPVRLHGDLGVTAKRFSMARPHDHFGLAVCLTEFGRGYVAERAMSGETVTERETAVEATYVFALGRGVTLQPDLQYVFNPHESGRDTLVGILRVSAAF